MRGRRSNRILSGLHVVKKRLASGIIRWNVYAWRGGPCIHRQDGARPIITPDLFAQAIAAREEASGGAPSDTFKAVIVAYRASPEFERLADSTQRDYNRILDRIDEQFGAAPIAAFEDRRMRRDIIEWRDLWRGQPRTADKAAVMMATVLGWAVENALLTINVAAGIPQLHSADKSDMIWEDRHWQAMADAPEQLMQALRLASMTGLRLGDLVRLDWSQVSDKAIILTTRKRKGRAVIPVIPELRSFLDTITHRQGVVLRNSRGLPWTESGLGTVFQRSKPADFDRTMHDLRGTYVTWLAMKGLTDDEIARIVGWTSQRIAEVRARYVDEARVIVSLVDRLSA
ncbi:tyrosine-type recombinase/integrase [Erythrobacter sp. HL-111]|uniref:tyrosine-type recombinase/integrase n=1 Tax=Erythrobacter sp. HL-111 TaxID=1798193 RepID=UPI0006DAC7D7|nr:tyrosine-type recombinase/integrase [Erythrobacter sp. HL-111]KPP87582.1 MAG: Phage integrase family [Erythrobacteraceae bacterium HL-111]SDR80287.1 Phage integrase family protein [Erythrobacter sp. HL-111]